MEKLIFHAGIIFDYTSYGYLWADGIHLKEAFMANSRLRYRIASSVPDIPDKVDAPAVVGVSKTLYSSQGQNSRNLSDGGYY